MHGAHIETTRDLDGEAIVLAVFELSDKEIAACAHALGAASGERFRTAQLSVDDVLELREMTALRDDLADLALVPGRRTLVLRPARLNALRDGVATFVDARDDAEWVRQEDAEPLAIVRGLLPAIADLCADAVRAALSPPPPAPT